MSNSDWTVYVKPRCPWCVEATAWLRKNDYAFREVDVIGDPEAYKKMQALSGQRYTPTLVVEESGLLLADFDTAQLQTFLKKNGLLKAA